MNDWTTFWFEGNLATGLIESQEDWNKIKNAYKSMNINLLAAKQNVYTTDPNIESFGFYSEHRGDQTLGEFAKNHNMDLS